MKFNYQARTQEGQIQTGVIEASSREAALLLLQKYGLYVTFLEVTKVSFYAKKIEIFQRISNKDVVVFSRQLAIMFKSNVPVVEALQTLAEQTKNQNFKEKILKIAEKVEGGTPLSASLASEPKIFSPFYTNIVKSGEASGKLSETLGYLADHSEREYNFYSKVISAMIYPLFVFFVFLIILILMVVFVIPQLSQVLGETGQELPQLTRMVIAFSNFLRRWWWVFILFFLGLGIFAFKFLRTKEGKKIVDKLFLKLPLLGEFFKKIYLSRLAENLSTLISSGLPIVRALEITGEIVGNDTYKTIILKTLDGVKKGEPMSLIFLRYPEFLPPLFIQMTVVGERTGQLDSALMNVVNFYQNDVERTLDSFISLLEPVMIIGLGVIVAGLVLSILLPIYRIGMF